MSSTDKVQTSAGNADPRFYEPSMEDILASIRRIIADDHAVPGRVHDGDGEANLRAALDGAPVHAERSQGGSPPSQDKPTFLRGTVDSTPVYRHPTSVLSQPAPQLLAQPQSQGRIAAPQFAMPDTPAPRPVEAQLAPAGGPPIQDARATTAPVAPQAEPEAGLDATLVSDAAGKAVSSSLGRLTVSRAVSRDAVISDMVNDLLRPLLKAWLDENLPPLVERLVQAEIERIHGSR